MEAEMTHFICTPESAQLVLETFLLAKVRYLSHRFPAKICVCGWSGLSNVVAIPEC